MNRVYCKECGKELYSNYKFCPKCGTTIEHSKLYPIVQNFDLDEFNQKDMLRILKPLIDIKHIENFIIRFNYKNIITNNEKKHLIDYFMEKYKCKAYIFDDGWDELTFSTAILYVNSMDLKAIIDYLFHYKIELFAIQDEWISFNDYVSGLKDMSRLFTPKYAFSFSYTYSTYDGIIINLIGDKEIYRDDVYFCEKFLNIRLIKKIISETTINIS